MQNFRALIQESLIWTYVVQRRLQCSIIFAFQLKISFLPKSSQTIHQKIKIKQNRAFFGAIKEWSSGRTSFNV